MAPLKWKLPDKTVVEKCKILKDIEEGMSFEGLWQYHVTDFLW